MSSTERSPVSLEEASSGAGDSKVTPALSLPERLGHEFSDETLLRRALTHPSVATTRPRDHYERLEFLGDRVLGLVVAELLWHRYPAEAEGPMARRHADAVCRDALAEVALKIGLDGDIQLARGEEVAGERANPAILADVCEAVLAALYLDGGLAAVERFIAREWLPLIEAKHLPPRDPKTGLQEWAQGRGLPLPRYRELGREGPAHEPRFTIEVTVQGFGPESATGGSKRAAERAAAEKLLTKLESESGKTET